ncbi:hypothetical protein BGZ60DRAFT_569327 [Tricladium varicosporioides]|nr:hypothetical protein BGZ60DRAFT_569327 [Hymenoscyphus varicosporioides]
MNLLIYSLLVFLSYVVPSEGGNIIFSSPVTGMTVAVGSPFIIQWTITVDSGDLTLESVSSGGTPSKLIATGLTGKSFTWTPSEADNQGSDTSGKTLRLTDRADSAREGASGTFNLVTPQKASSSLALPGTTLPTLSQNELSSVASTSNPPSSASPSILPTNSLPLSPTPSSNTPPTTLTTQGPSTIITNDESSTLVRSTLSSNQLLTLSPSSTPTLNSTSGDGDRRTVTTSSIIGTTQVISTPSGTPANKSSTSMTTATKIGIAVGVIAGILAILIVGYYLGKKTAARPIELPIETKRPVSAVRILKAELDTAVEILELEAGGKEAAELEARTEARAVARVELEDTSTREPLEIVNRISP